MSSPDTAPAEGVEALTLGQRLRRDREAAGRSLEELSAELHLSLDRLRALEEDRFDELSGPAFVKGYLRAWARAVGGDAEQYLREYLRLEVAAPHWAPHEPVEVEDEPARRRLLWLSAALAAVLGVLLLLWLWRGGHSEWVPASPPAVDTEEPGAPAAAPEPASDSAAPVGDDPADNAPPASSEPATAEAAATGATPAGPATEAAAGGPASAEGPVGEASPAGVAPGESAPEEQAEPVRPQPQPAGPAPEAGAEVATAAATGGKTAQPAGAGPDRIEIEFNQDSWVEITDANQRMLLRGLLVAGARRELRGTAPFQVFLGNAPGVILRFNGQNFDMAPFVRSNNTARFALVGDHSG